MVVIPVHNGVGMIERTLDSLIKQSYTDFRVVVIDNCSDDGTEEVVKDYIRNINLLSSTLMQLNYIKNKKDLGRIGNWNKALDVFRESDSEYCKIMFVGDTIEPECLGVQLEEMDVDKQVVTSAHIVVKENEDSYIMQHVHFGTVFTPVGALELSLQKGNWFAGTTSCVLFSKQALAEIKFRPGLHWAGDWLFWVQLALNTNVTYLVEPLASFYMDSRKGYKRMAGSKEADREEMLVKEHIKTYLKVIDKI